jgi:hypothetical protein
MHSMHPSSAAIKSKCTPLDLLAHEAFKQQRSLRRASSDFPPLARGAPQAPRALAILDGCVALMLRRDRAPGADLLCRARAALVTSLVVEVGMLQAAGGGGAVPRHTSDAALLGVCHLHHLLLTVCTTRPSSAAMIESARRGVEAFLSWPPQRHKSHCRDLGVLAVKLLVVPMDAVPWARLAPVFTHELLACQVLWAERERGGGFTANLDDPDAVRMGLNFATARASLRYAAREAWFANALARRASSASPPARLARIREACDAGARAPLQALFARFSEHARGVLAHTGWRDVLKSPRLGLRIHPQRALESATAAGERAMADVLRQAVVDSQAAGYHRVYGAPRCSCTFEAWALDAPPLAACSDAW